VLSLEFAARGHLVALRPHCIASVEDEPTVSPRHEAVLGSFERGLRNHPSDHRKIAPART
jgi:glutaredoxin